MDDRELESLFPYIAHRYRPLTETGGWFYTALIHNGFSSVTVLGLRLLPEIAVGMPRKNPDEPIFVYVARHRSEFDYALLLAALFKQGMFATTQAGDNLFIGPLGPFMAKRGAFKVLRFKEGETKTFYHWGWKRDRFYKMWAKIPVLRKALRKKPVVLTRQDYRRMYALYIRHLVREGYDIQVYPEFEWSAKGKKRLGRSKSGLLNPMAAAVFESLLDAERATGRPVFIVPVNVNYERVPEDTNIRRIQAVREYLARKLRLGNAIGNAVSYSFDFVYNILLCLPGVNIVPRARRPATIVHIGEPYRLAPPEGEDLARATAQSAMISSRYPDKEDGREKPSEAELAANVARMKVGALEVAYPCQLVAYSALEPLMNEGWWTLMREVFGQEGKNAGYGPGLPDTYVVPLEELRRRYHDNFRFLSAKNFSIHEVAGPGGGPISLEEALGEMDRFFATRLLINPIFDWNEKELTVKDMPTFVQYANHIAHLFREEIAAPPSQR
jgi:1-acyl-sn-glycerol-3-phosphate acyltransferase